jgi:hypothetical protein
VSLVLPLDDRSTDLARGLDRPVLAAITERAPVDHVVGRAAAVADALDAPLRILLLYPRTGFSTDPALLAQAAYRRMTMLDDLRAELRRRRPGVLAPDSELVPYARLPLADPARQAWRACEAVAWRCEARLVVAPEPLAEVARAQRVLAVVGVAAPVPGPAPW